MVKAAEVDAPVPAVTPSTPTPYRLPPSSVPTIFAKLYGTVPLPVRMSVPNACQRSTDVCQHELSMSYWSTVDNRLVHMR